MLIDSHCHLDFADFGDETPEIVKRAHAAGVGGMITICTEVSKFAQVLAVAEKFADQNVWCSVGVHPHHGGDAPEQVEVAELMRLAQHQRVVGIGECGLDYFYEHSDHPSQQKSFETQLEAALALDLPVIIHSRDADDDTIRILKAAGPKLRGVMHCFSGTRYLCDEALALGFYISCSGIITFKKSQDLRDIVKDVPLDKLLVETDAPYLAPMPLRGKRNEPAYTTHTARVLAELKGVSEAALAEATTRNFFTLFNKAKLA